MRGENAEYVPDGRSYREETSQVEAQLRRPLEKRKLELNPQRLKTRADLNSFFVLTRAISHPRTKF